MEDYRAGVLAAVTANVHRDPKARAEPWGPDDFFDLPSITTEEASASASEVMTPTQLKAAAHAITGWARAKARAEK